MKSLALELGFTSVGVAPVVAPPHYEAYRKWIEKGYHGEMDYLARHLELKRNARNLLASARSVIAVTLNYFQDNAPQPGQPRIARYALGRDYHKVMRAKLQRLGKVLKQAHPEAEFRACVDSAPILERDFARLAGLGWFGKNTCLIDSKRGSWFFIGLLLTSLDISPDAPALGSCGTCRKCIDACPTGAIVFEDQRWQVDARRCVSYLTIEHRGAIAAELEPGVGDWMFGCDICQEVCPFNAPRESQPLRGRTTEEPQFLSLREWPSLPEMAEMDYDYWDRLTRGSAVRRARYEGLRRNARINLKAGERS